MGSVANPMFKRPRVNHTIVAKNAQTSFSKSMAKALNRIANVKTVRYMTMVMLSTEVWLGYV